MRWMAWNIVGCILWLAGLAYAKGMDLLGATVLGDGHQILTGLIVGCLGIILLTWVNIVDAS